VRSVDTTHCKGLRTKQPLHASDIPFWYTTGTEENHVNFPQDFNPLDRAPNLERRANARHKLLYVQISRKKIVFTS
jgi:hypothetical protein